MRWKPHLVPRFGCKGIVISGVTLSFSAGLASPASGDWHSNIDTFNQFASTVGVCPQHKSNAGYYCAEAVWGGGLSPYGHVEFSTGINGEGKRLANGVNSRANNGVWFTPTAYDSSQGCSTFWRYNGGTSYSNLSSTCDDIGA
jgi:hypothetical protein